MNDNNQEKLIHLIKKLRKKHFRKSDLKLSTHTSRKISTNNIIKQLSHNSKSNIIKDNDYWSDINIMLHMCLPEMFKKNNKITSDKLKKITIKAEKIFESTMKRLKVRSVNLPNGTPNLAITLGVLSQCKKLNPKFKDAKVFKLTKKEEKKLLDATK